MHCAWVSGIECIGNSWSAIRPILNPFSFHKNNIEDVPRFEVQSAHRARYKLAQRRIQSKKEHEKDILALSFNTMLKEITHEGAVDSPFPQKWIYTFNANFARWRSSKGASSRFTAIWLTYHDYHGSHLNYICTKTKWFLIDWCSKANAASPYPSANVSNAETKATYCSTDISVNAWNNFFFQYAMGIWKDKLGLFLYNSTDSSGCGRLLWTPPFWEFS